MVRMLLRSLPLLHHQRPAFAATCWATPVSLPLPSFREIIVLPCFHCLNWIALTRRRIRRWRRQSEATDYGQPTSSSTKWRVSSMPSEELPVPGVGRARWMVELLRARAGESFDVEVGACDAQGRMSGTGNLKVPDWDIRRSSAAP